VHLDIASKEDDNVENFADAMTTTLAKDLSWLEP
jgi:hypothetical protein